MYRLRLVCDKAEVCELYEHFAEWENLGFERPCVVRSAEEGIACLTKERYDAVSSLLSVSEGKRFLAYLSKRPEMMGVETARDEARLRREISRARRTLSSRDAARQQKQVDDLTKAIQEEFFCDLLRGMPYDREKIDERMRELKLTVVDAARPICTASFRLPQGDYFLAEVWRYGRERLENALRNIFECDNGRMCFVLLIINPHHMRLIGMPREEMDGDEVYEQMMLHIRRCQEALEEYFELTLTVKRVVRYDNLYALGQENALRTAH